MHHIALLITGLFSISLWHVRGLLFLERAVYRYFMFAQKNAVSPVWTSVFFVRVVHVVLFGYAASIIGITFSFPGYAIPGAPVMGNLVYTERMFAISVALPLLLGSFFCFFAAATRSLFGTAIFFCVFASLMLGTLPLMATLFFPMHFVGFFLAALYVLSAIILVRFWFSLPVSKKR